MPGKTSPHPLTPLLTRFCMLEGHLKDSRANPEGEMAKLQKAFGLELYSTDREIEVFLSLVPNW